MCYYFWKFPPSVMKLLSNKLRQNSEMKASIATEVRHKHSQTYYLQRHSEKEKEKYWKSPNGREGWRLRMEKRELNWDPRRRDREKRVITSDADGCLCKNGQLGGWRWRALWVCGVGQWEYLSTSHSRMSGSPRRSISRVISKALTAGCLTSTGPGGWSADVWLCVCTHTSSCSWVWANYHCEDISAGVPNFKGQLELTLSIRLQ